MTLPSESPLRRSDRDELRAAARDLLDKPRDVFGDHGAETLWRNRIARRIRAVADGRAVTRETR